jgi:hypothetical protein
MKNIPIAVARFAGFNIFFVAVVFAGIFKLFKIRLILLPQTSKAFDLGIHQNMALNWLWASSALLSTNSERMIL